MSIVHPVVILPVAGLPVRFFAGPSGQPELPWHSADDLFAACGFSEPMRDHFRRSLQQIFNIDIRTVATPTGPVVIAPHVAAQGLLGAAADVRHELPNRIAKEYALAAAAAMDAMIGDVEPDEWVAYIGQAARNSGVGE